MSKIAPKKKATVKVSNNHITKAVVVKTKPVPAPAKRRKRKPTYAAKIERSVKQLMPMISKQDFALIYNKQEKMYAIEPQRSLCMVCVDFFNLSHDTDIKEIITSKQGTKYIMKSKVWDQKGNTSSGFGMSTTLEVDPYNKNSRRDHDALTRAATRSLKRAIESRAGFTVINKLILAHFDSFYLDDQYKPIMRNVTPANGGAPTPPDLPTAVRPQEPKPVSKGKKYTPPPPPKGKPPAIEGWDITKLFEETAKLIEKTPFPGAQGKTLGDKAESLFQEKNRDAMRALYYSVFNMGARFRGGK